MLLSFLQIFHIIVYSNNWSIIDMNQIGSSELNLQYVYHISVGTHMHTKQVRYVPVWEIMKSHTKSSVFKIQCHSDFMYVNKCNIMVLDGWLQDFGALLCIFFHMETKVNYQLLVIGCWILYIIHPLIKPHMCGFLNQIYFPVPIVNM